jgi:hypothetical protein
VVLAALICSALDAISFGLNLLLRPFRRQPPDTPEEYRARLQEPQWEVLAAHFGASVPASLQELYRRSDRLELTDFSLGDPEHPGRDAGYFICRFLPADQKALEAIPRKLPEPLFPFAEDGSGRRYCVRIEAARPAPCPVYIWSRRPSDRRGRKIADSLDEFIARPVRPRRASGAGP